MLKTRINVVFYGKVRKREILSYKKVVSDLLLSFLSLIVFLYIILNFSFLQSNQNVLLTTWIGHTRPNNDYPNCELCQITTLVRKTYGNSTPRDVIITTAYGRLINVFPFARSLRTVGCKARIVAFVDEDALSRYDSVFYDKMKDCGVEFVKIHRNGELGNLKDATAFRYSAYLKYLKANRNKIDRVITVDLFDTCVQYDPFTNEFKKENIYFQTEGELIKDDGYNLNWAHCSYTSYEEMIGSIAGKQVFLKDVINISKINFTEVVDNYIINGGEQAAGVDIMIKFLELIRSSCTYCQDQGFINYYFYTGILEKVIDAKAIALPYGDELFTAIGIKAFLKLFKYSNGALGTVRINGSLPAMIHQFDRNKELTQIVLEACPNYDPPFPDYIRK